MLPRSNLFAAVLCFLVGHMTQAGSATWELNPTSDAWTVAANWTPQTVPNDPTDVATFDASNITAIAISRTRVVAVAEIVFDPGASAYTISASGILNIFGAGITNNSGAEQNLVVPGFGSSIRFRNNNGCAPIAGTFSNLPDGGTITVGENTFQANYESGDGNNLTLTVVP